MSDEHKQHDQSHHHSLPWLERLVMRVPAYRGYQSSHQRHAADVALREAVAVKLEEAVQSLGHAKRQCLDREAFTEAESLDRISVQIHHASDRVRHASSGIEQFNKSSEFRAAKADALHAIDHELLEMAEEFAKLCAGASSGKDWQPHVVKHLQEFERKLDARSQHHSLASG